jgi:enamine deaminase RidA (YjgF/YER057c/UK114 family)
MAVSQRLEELGIVLPQAPQAVAAYVPAVLSGPWCFTAGQLPLEDGKLMAVGRLGADLDENTAYRAARQCALNAISAAAQRVGGVDRLIRVVKVVGFVQSTDDFHGQPAVVNGASEVLEAVFGEAGRHARSAVGTNALPLNAPVEVEVIFEVAP